jgi:hypothetical protein
MRPLRKDGTRVNVTVTISLTTQIELPRYVAIYSRAGLVQRQIEDPTLVTLSKNTQYAARGKTVTFVTRGDKTAIALTKANGTFLI